MNFIFKERFDFTLASGFDEFSLKVYSAVSAEGRPTKQQLEEEFKLKLAEELVALVDQREHIKILTGKNLAVKLSLRWVYDSDIERLTELQALQIKFDKELQ